MEKNWKKKFLQNLGAILLSGLWAVVGFYLTKDLKLDQTGGMIYFGEKSFTMMVAWFIPGLVCISYIYREIKLLIQLFLNGGVKEKIVSIVVSTIILITLCAGIVIFSNAQQGPHTKVLDAYFRALQENDTKTIDSLVWPFFTHEPLWKQYCKSPKYISIEQSSEYREEHISVQCEGESIIRIYELIYDDLHSPYGWKIAKGSVK